MILILALIIGIAIGIFLPYNIPEEYTVYAAIGILTALDSAFECACIFLANKFSVKKFVFGFFENLILAFLLVFIGNKIMGVSLYFAAVFAFGVKIFENFGKIREFLFAKFEKKK